MLELANRSDDQGKLQNSQLLQCIYRKVFAKYHWHCLYQSISVRPLNKWLQLYKKYINHTSENTTDSSL